MVSPRGVNAISPPVQNRSGTVSLKRRSIAGREDSSAGLVWRAQDADNYYLVRAYLLRGSISIYDTVNGHRSEKKRATVQLASTRRHTLRVEFQGTHVAVLCDGETALEWDDDRFRDAGKVGVWTKADSVTFLDDFRFGTR